VDAVEEHLNKLQRISPNMPKAMKLFGKFLTEIINDKEAGEEYLERARNLINLNNNKKITMMNYTGSEEIGENSTPTVLVSGEPDKLGIISSINLAASSIFGYTKSELINRNIKILMSQIYGRHHDQFLENYINTSEMKFPNKERIIFAKHKSNYIFPVFVNIKATQNNYQNLNFVGTFRQDKHFKITAYMTIYNDGTIDAISSSCITILRIDSKMIINKSRIQDFFPHILDDRDDFMSKSGMTVSHSYPKEADHDTSNTGDSVDLNCMMSELMLPGMETPGYILKFKPLGDKDSQIAQGRKHKPCTFQFRFDRHKGIVIGEFTDNLVDDLLSDGEYQPGLGFGGTGTSYSEHLGGGKEVSEVEVEK
jgi:PAS domain S-box-containing protein